MRSIFGSDQAINKDGLVDRFKDQLLIVMLKRLGGGPLQISIAEIDQTGSDLVTFRLDDDNFVLDLIKKS